MNSSFPIEKRDIQHLYQRAGFGAMPQFVQANVHESRIWHVQKLFSDSESNQPLQILEDPAKGKDKDVGKFKLGLLFVKSRKELKELNLAWLDKMADTKAQLRERMTFFWHNHFATSVQISYLMQVQNNTLRKFALGKFGDLLHAVAKDPAMLMYLNNQQNKKNHPNENFAREVMELFCLGEGNYTENDIKEAARAFTGWQISGNGRFLFNEKQHDFGEKTIFGKTGKFSGEDVLDMLIAHPATSKHLARKLYLAFVNDVPDEAHIAAIAQSLQQNDLDIGAGLVHIFVSDWFYEAKNVGAMVKSPVDLLVGLKRILKIDFKRDQILLKAQKALGQILFFPPNVAGWPKGTQWIDSSTLMLRMRIPLVILGADQFDISAKPDFEDEGSDDMEIGAQKSPKMLRADVEWKHLAAAFSGISEDELPQAIVDALITCPQSNIDLKNVMAYADNSSKISLIQSLAIRVMALPEYQLK